MVVTKKLLIFDIDGTLTDNGGLTRVALELAAKEMYGVDRTTAGITSWGQTDHNIFKLMVENNHLPVSNVQAEFPIFIALYTAYLQKLLFESPRPRLHVGVRELLDQLVKEPDICLALGTGNIEQTGRMKLERHKVDHLFAVGGFGSDSAERPVLLQIALDRGRLHFGEPFISGDYWVIGDTPNDVKSGKAIGAGTIAVCTGTYNREELAKHNPDAVLSDLSDIERFLAIVRTGADPLANRSETRRSVGEEPDPL